MVDPQSDLLRWDASDEDELEGGVQVKDDQAGGPGLTPLERTRLLHNLDVVKTATLGLEQQLLLAAARQGFDELTGWTTSQLDAMMNAARSLERTVRKTNTTVE